MILPVKSCLLHRVITTIMAPPGINLWTGPDWNHSHAGSNTSARPSVSAYDRALVLQTDWPEAMNNRKIAQLRAEKTNLEGGDMTGGKLAADDVVFDTQKRDSQEGGKEQVEGEQTMSDSELQAL